MTMTAHVTRAANVLAFPKRTFAASPKPLIKSRETKSTNVLKFTGKTIRNIDGEACREDWQASVISRLTHLLDMAVQGDITGLLTVYTGGLVTDGGDKKPTSSGCATGLFCEDFDFAAQAMHWFADKAAEKAEESPTRWL